MSISVFSSGLNVQFSFYKAHNGSIKLVKCFVKGQNTFWAAKALLLSLQQQTKVNTLGIAVYSAIVN